MRLSLAQAAAGALTTVVAAGLLVLPTRLLGPEQDASPALRLPGITATPTVHAALPAAAATQRHRATRRADSNGSASLASVVKRPLIVPAAVSAARTAPAHIAHRSAPQGARLIDALSRQRHRPPPDPARPPPTPTPTPTPTPAPVPKPAPVVDTPTATRTLADAAPPVLTPTPAPAPCDQGEHGEQGEQGGEDDQGDNGNGNGNAGDRGNGDGHGNGNAQGGGGRGQGHGSGHGA
jgi:fermentation-respiration switch protein FrsA (DUF1100 family)